MNLQFKNIEDLDNKVEKLKQAHLDQVESVKRILDTNNIGYEQVNHYTVLINGNELNNEHITAINKSHERLKIVYKDLKIQP